MFDFLLNIVIFDDRAGDQLWEKGYVQKHFSKIFLSFVCPTVHIDHVGHRLKREKGNTDRQTDVWNRKSRPEHRIHALRKKACIFKDHQKCEIQDHRHTDDPFLLILKPFDPKCK